LQEELAAVALEIESEMSPEEVEVIDEGAVL
jgi:hypothetical protein